MLNLVSEEMRRDPYPAYAQLRATSPVLHMPDADLWMVFDYDGVRRVLTDHEAFHSNMEAAGRTNPEWFIFVDPPRHTRMRGLIMRAFTPRVVVNLEPRLREISRGLIDAAIARGEMDLAEDYAVPLPTTVIAEMLGMPTEDLPRFKHWSDVILNLSYDIAGGEAAQRAAQEYGVVKIEMQQYLQSVLAQRRAAPRDDLLTRLLEAEVDGEHLSEPEILGFFQLLIIAGTETTTNLIDNAILALLEHPDQLARLRATPALLATAIEEVLRFRSPVQWMFRATSRAVELGGQSIPAGRLVLPVIGSANRDAAQFPDADAFDIGREPNPHIAFGHGLHFCLGAALSRLETQIALPDLLTRLPGLCRAEDGPWLPRKALHVHGPSRLPVRFAASSRAD